MPAGKGKGKSRGGSGTTNRGRSRSRNTTPASATDFASVSDSGGTGTTENATVPSYGDVISMYMPGPGADTGIPPSTALGGLQKDLMALHAAAGSRVVECDEAIAKWEAIKKAKDEQDEKDAKEKGEERERVEKKDRDKVKAKEEKERKKKERAASDDSTHRPHALGAHQPTTQAPANVFVKDEPVEGQTIKKKRRGSPKDEDEEMSVDVKTPKPEEEEEDVPSDDDQQPAPIPAVIVYEELDDDPSVYEIGTVTAETTVEEKKKIFSVADFPQVDISDLLPGDAPDEDFSRAKPTNQVAMNSFLTYIEPYFRPFTEEDMAFLRERGDRATPYVLPALGRHYKEVWAEEDGEPIPNTSNALENNALGKPDDLDDSASMKNNVVSLGPLLSRVMAGMVSEDPEEEAPPPENKDGDVTMANATGTNGTTENGTDGTPNVSKSTATSIPLPEGIVAPKDWKFTPGAPDYANIEERIRQEMIYMGMVGPSDTFHFADRQDDEVSARFRELQAELREVAIRNGARKARLTELLKEQLAYQEYSTILEDLDKQVDQAYLKRTRGMKAKKKRAGPNGHVASGAAKPAIGDVARTLMERRKKWRDTIGPVFDKGLTAIPTKTIFDPAIMAGLEQKEATGEVEED